MFPSVSININVHWDATSCGLVDSEVTLKDVSALSFGSSGRGMPTNR